LAGPAERKWTYPPQPRKANSRRYASIPGLQEEKSGKEKRDWLRAQQKEEQKLVASQPWRSGSPGGGKLDEEKKKKKKKKPKKNKKKKKEPKKKEKQKKKKKKKHNLAATSCLLTHLPDGKGPIRGQISKD